ncbi:MAG: hypothetical protein ACLUW6_00555 [Coriobacteriaceae bacterium]
MQPPDRPRLETIAGKLPQRKIVTTAAAGYSSYGNQISLATGQVRLYHPATWKAHGGRRRGGRHAASHVRRECPAPATRSSARRPHRRDGIGSATNLKAHNVESIEGQRRGQKSNAPMERKLHACSAAATPAA